MNLKEASRPIYLSEPAISIALGAPRKKPSRQILSSTQLPTILGRTTKISATTDAHRAGIEPHTKNILFAFLSPSVLTLLGFSFSQLRTDP